MTESEKGVEMLRLDSESNWPGSEDARSRTWRSRTCVKAACDLRDDYEADKTRQFKQGGDYIANMDWIKRDRKHINNCGKSSISAHYDEFCPDKESEDDEQKQGGYRKRRRRKTKRKTRKRRRVGKNKKELKRLQTQYRRFKIAKGDKRFKGTKNLIKWSRTSKAKRKGKRRSRRIYHRKRR